MFVRWIDPEKHREAITSRPLLLYGVAKKIKHANQIKLKITSLHGKQHKTQDRISLIINFLNRIKYYTQQFTQKEIWSRILSAIFIKFLKGRVLKDGKRSFKHDDQIQLIQINSS